MLYFVAGIFCSSIFDRWKLLILISYCQSAFLFQLCDEILQHLISNSAIKHQVCSAYQMMSARQKYLHYNELLLLNMMV